MELYEKWPKRTESQRKIWNILELADSQIKAFLWLNWLKLNEHWRIVASQESLAKYNKLSKKWRSILEDNNLSFLCVVRGNVFSNYKCHQSVLYLMFIIIVFHYLQELWYLLLLDINLTILIKYWNVIHFFHYYFLRRVWRY
jgi:hypothetical protein